MKDPASITLQYVIQVANSFLNKYHPTLSIPVPIENIVELNLNIRIVLIRDLVRNFGINAFISRAFDTIVIDDAMYSRQPDRIRFTIAEEIGHLFLHKEWYKENGPKSFEDYLKWQEKIDNIIYSYIERQAKTFAGLVLMPKSCVNREWAEFARNNNLSIPCSVYNLPDTFPDVAQKFEVSAESILVRLSALKLVTVPDGFWKKTKR